MMRFGGHISGVVDESYDIFGSRLEFVNSYRDLGIVVDSSLKFHAHIDLIAGRVGSMMSNLLRSTVCRSRDFMVTLWVSHIRPLIKRSPPL